MMTGTRQQRIDQTGRLIFRLATGAV